MGFRGVGRAGAASCSTSMARSRSVVRLCSHSAFPKTHTVVAAPLSASAHVHLQHGGRTLLAFRQHIMCLLGSIICLNKTYPLFLICIQHAAPPLYHIIPYQTISHDQISCEYDYQYVLIYHSMLWYCSPGYKVPGLCCTGSKSKTKYF